MNPTIHFQIRLDRPAKDGSVPIYLVFLINREHRTKISIGKSVPLKPEYKNLSHQELMAMTAEARKTVYAWNENLERLMPAAHPTNRVLDKEKARAIAVVEKFELMGRPITIELFQNAFCKPSGSNSFCEYFEKEVLEKRKSVLSAGTLKNFSTTISKIDKFRPNLTLADITYKFLSELENYMLAPRSEKGLGNNQNTVSKTMSILRTLLLIAVKNGDLHKDNYPFKDYRIKHVDPVLTSRDYLEPADLLKVEQLLSPDRIECLTPGEIKATKRFLFACYTGLRFSDVNNLHWNRHIFSKYVFNPNTKQMVFRNYIEITMTKTAMPVFIPLIDKATELMDEKKDDFVFRPISNQKINAHLKEINRKAGLNKKLSFHVARHSFATICFLYGIPLEVGQKLLGHRNRKFTEIYTHLSKNKLFYEMDKLNKGLSEYSLIVEEVNPKTKSLKEILPVLQELSFDNLEQLKGLLKLFK